MDQIYFNNNSFQIKDEEIVALAKIVVVMTQFPEMQILVCSHVNCTNKNDYDVWLLKRKSGYILKYMINSGIDASRLSFDGFKKKVALNHLCPDGECSKLELHEKGKLEFIVKWNNNF